MRRCLLVVVLMVMMFDDDGQSCIYVSVVASLLA